MTPSEKRLLRLVCQLIPALENPASGFVFDDFDRRYREKEQKREKDAAHWYYRDKLSFETKYGEDCGKDPCNEPGWVSDGGRGCAAQQGVVSYDLDGDEDAEDDPKKRGKVSGTWAKRRAAALKRVNRHLPHAAETLKLIVKNINNSKESICSLVKSKLFSRGNGNSRGKSTNATGRHFLTSSKRGRKNREKTGKR